MAAAPSTVLDAIATAGADGAIATTANVEPEELRVFSRSIDGRDDALAFARVPALDGAVHVRTVELDVGAVDALATSKAARVGVNGTGDADGTVGQEDQDPARI